jgi:anti-sigma B factor antagonist
MAAGASEGATIRAMAVTGSLDLRAAGEIRLQAATAIAAGGGSLALDLSRVGFIDSSGLGVLTGLHGEADRLGGRLVIVMPSGSARQIFPLTRTETLFTLVETLDDARAALTA